MFVPLSFFKTLYLDSSPEYVKDTNPQEYRQQSCNHDKVFHCTSEIFSTQRSRSTRSDTLPLCFKAESSPFLPPLDPFPNIRDACLRFCAYATLQKPLAGGSARGRDPSSRPRSALVKCALHSGSISRTEQIKHGSGQQDVCTTPGAGTQL